MDQPGSSRALLAEPESMEHDQMEQQQQQPRRRRRRRNHNAEITTDVFLRDCLGPLPSPYGLTSAMEPSTSAQSMMNMASDGQGPSEMFRGESPDGNPRPMIADFKTGHLYKNHKYTYDPFYDKSTNMLKQEPDSEVMHKLVLDYLITEGYGDVAEALCEESGMEFPTEQANSLEQRMAIRSAIVEEGDVEKAITMVNALAPNLVDEQDELRLRLQQQQIIELIRNNQLKEALEIGGQTMSNAHLMDESFLQDMERTFALMAFDNPSTSQFGKLLEMDHRQQVANFTNSAVLKAMNDQPISRLEACFKLMVYLNYQIHMNANPHGCAALLIQTTGGTREDHELTLAEKMFTTKPADKE